MRVGILTKKKDETDKGVPDVATNPGPHSAQGTIPQVQTGSVNQAFGITVLSPAGRGERHQYDPSEAAQVAGPVSEGFASPNPIALDHAGLGHV